jgi:hypothetical protein
MLSLFSPMPCYQESVYCLIHQLIYKQMTVGVERCARRGTAAEQHGAYCLQSQEMSALLPIPTLPMQLIQAHPALATRQPITEFSSQRRGVHPFFSPHRFLSHLHSSIYTRAIAPSATRRGGSVVREERPRNERTARCAFLKP